MIDLTPSIADLKANWHHLADYDRALRVRPIIQAGMSRRQLAVALGVSEGTVRGLILMLQAETSDLNLFRWGKISRNELLRRVRGHSPAPKQPNPQPEPPKPAPIRRTFPRIDPIPRIPLLVR